MAGSTPTISTIVPVANIPEKKVDPYSTSSVREFIKREFPDAPIMVQIASCESHFKQFKSDGSVNVGIQNPLDTGVFMVNKYWHEKEALQKGINLDTLEGNVAFARILYDRNGTRDWNWSKYPIGKFKGWEQGECS